MHFMMNTQQLERAIEAAERGDTQPPVSQGLETQRQEEMISAVMNDLELQRAETSANKPRRSDRVLKRKSTANDELDRRRVDQKKIKWPNGDPRSTQEMLDNVFNGRIGRPPPPELPKKPNVSPLPPKRTLPRADKGKARARYPSSPLSHTFKHKGEVIPDSEDDDYPLLLPLNGGDSGSSIEDDESLPPKLQYCREVSGSTTEDDTPPPAEKDTSPLVEEDKEVIVKREDEHVRVKTEDDQVHVKREDEQVHITQDSPVSQAVGTHAQGIILAQEAADEGLDMEAPDDGGMSPMREGYPVNLEYNAVIEGQREVLPPQAAPPADDVHQPAPPAADVPQAAPAPADIPQVAPAADDVPQAAPAPAEGPQADPAAANVPQVDRIPEARVGAPRSARVAEVSLQHLRAHIEQGIRYVDEDVADLMVAEDYVHVLRPSAGVVRTQNRLKQGQKIYEDLKVKYEAIKEPAFRQESPTKRMATVYARHAHEVAARTIVGDTETKEYEANVALILAKREQEEALATAVVARAMFLR